MRKSIQIILAFSAFALCATLFTGCSAKARTSRHQQRANSYYASGDFSKAEIEYLIVLRLDRTNPHAINRLGDIYFQQGRYGRAFPFVEKACEVATNDINMQVKLGTIYAMMHKTKESRSIAEFILKLSPTNAEAPDLLAESVTTRADLGTVRKQLDDLSKKVGDTSPVQLGYAILDFAEGDMKATETALQRALTLDPKNSAAYYTLGRLYWSQNKIEQAGANFKLATDNSPKRSARRLSYAVFKIQTGDIKGGKQLLEEISKDVPDFVPAWIRQAEIALAERRFDDAEALLTQAVARDGDNFEALFLRGRLFLAKGQSDKAITEFTRLETLYGQTPDVQYQKAMAYLALNDRDKALVELNAVLVARPKFTEAILLTAGLNLNKGEIPTAINALTQVIRDQPGVAEAYVILGRAYVMQNNTDQALEIFTKAAELFPKNAQVVFLKGMVLAQKGNNAEARKALEQTLVLSPHFVTGLEELVNLDLIEGNYTAALERLNKETDETMGPGRELIVAKIYTARAQSVAKKSGKYIGRDIALDSPAVKDDVDHAEAALQKAIDLKPADPGPYLLQAQLSVAAGKQQEALDRLTALVAKTNNVMAYMQIGGINEAMKDYPKARDAYEKALTINPGFSGALNNLAYLYAERLGQPDKALPLAEKVRQLQPKDPSTADTLGWIVFKKGDYARARTLLEESVAKLPNQAEVQFHVGMVRYMMGDEQQARAALQAAAASTADFPGKGEAAQRLATLAIVAKAGDAKTQADLEKRLQDEPNDAVAADRLGEIYELNGTLDKAAKTYEQSLKQNPQNAPTMGRLAKVYVQLHQVDKALDMAKEAHKLAAADADITALLGRLVFQSGDYNWSANLLQDAASRLPGRADVQYDLAWSYYTQGRVDDAQRTMQGAASALTSPQKDDATVFLAMLAAAKAPAAATAATATQLLATNADYVPAMMVAGAQAEQQGKADAAVQYYSKALTRYPAFVPAARKLVIIYSKGTAADDQKAYDLAGKSRAMFPDDTELTRALGVLAYRHGEFTRAAQLLQESSQTLTNDGELYYYLGMAQYQLKHLPQSKTALQRALSLNITAKPAEDARKVLAELK